MEHIELNLDMDLEMVTFPIIVVMQANMILMMSVLLTGLEDQGRVRVSLDIILVIMLLHHVVIPMALLLLVKPKVISSPTAAMIPEGLVVFVNTMVLVGVTPQVTAGLDQTVAIRGQIHATTMVEALTKRKTPMESLELIAVTMAKIHQRYRK